jgi:hypothetical protein
MLQENIHFQKKRAVKVTTMNTLFASNQDQEIKSPPLHVVSPPIIIKRLDLMTDFMAQTPDPPGSSANLNTETKAPGGSEFRDAYALSGRHDSFDQGIIKKKSKFAHLKFKFDSISSSKHSQFPDVTSELDAPPKKQDIEVALRPAETPSPTKTSPKILKGQSSSEKYIGSGSKKKSAAKRRRISSKSIAFLSPCSNFENLELLDAKFDSKIYHRPSTADFHGQTPAKKRKITFNGKFSEFSSSANLGEKSQRSHFLGVKQLAEPSMSQGTPTLLSVVQAQGVDKKDLMITHLLNLIDKMQGDYTKLTEKCFKANKELLAVKSKKVYGSPKNDIPKSKMLSQFSNKSPSKLSGMAEAFSNKDLVEKSRPKRRTKILGQEVAMQTSKALESMIDYADSDQPARNFVTPKVFDFLPS